MILSLYTAAAGMNAQQFHIDTISNNLANVNTTAYKRARPEFQDLLYLTVRRPVAPQTLVGLNVGLG
ncbi:MAG: flagellar basal body protein, partial [Syntrophaceticus sp.]